MKKFKHVYEGHTGLQHNVSNKCQTSIQCPERARRGFNVLEDMSMHFAGRFDALVRSGERLWGTQPNEIEDLVRDELLSVGERDGQRLTIAGPSYGLNRQQAPLIGLALHELATNAIKFGALSGPRGLMTPMSTRHYRFSPHGREGRRAQRPFRAV